MIGFIRGRIVSKEPGQVIVETGGIGYQVLIPLSTYYQLGGGGDEVQLHVHTLVRDDAIELFGFTSRGEKTLFRRLIAISGVGPRIALAILSGLGPGDLLAAVEEGETDTIRQVPGVGRKTAERLVLELRDKLPDLRSELESDSLRAGSPADALKLDIISALVNLGYKRRDAQRATGRVLADGSENIDFGAALRAALAELTGIM